MKDSADKATVDLFQEKKGRGRPVTGHAKSDAQRMREYRLRRKGQGVRVIVDRPVDIETIRHIIDDENNLYRENDRLTQERDDALKLVADLQQQLQLLMEKLK